MRDILKKTKKKLDQIHNEDLDLSVQPNQYATGIIKQIILRNKERRVTNVNPKVLFLSMKEKDLLEEEVRESCPRSHRDYMRKPLFLDDFLGMRVITSEDEIMRL